MLHLNPCNPTSVCIFSKLFSIHFLRCWQGKFVLRSKAALVGDHFIHSYDLRICLIQGWYCKENLDASHSKELKGLIQSCTHKHVGTSFPNCTKMSLNFFIICELIASRDLMCLKFKSMSKAPSADLSVLNESSMKCLASFSMAVTSLWNQSITFRQLAACLRLKASNPT